MAQPTTGEQPASDWTSKVPHRRRASVQVRGALLLLLLLLLVALPARVEAEVEGTPPSQLRTFRLFGSHSATGAALLRGGPYYPQVNSVDLGSTSASIFDVPFDGEVEAAFLFWSGSAPRTNRDGPPDGPDVDVDFATPDGVQYVGLLADTCATVPGLGGFYYCRREVTDLLPPGPGNANGSYTVGGVDADPGMLDSVDPQWIYAQAKYAGWSLLLVWRATSNKVRRDVVIYDGFIRLDETNAAPGLLDFQIDGYQVGDPAGGRLTVFGLEGDGQLGVPPESLASGNFDYIAFQSASAASRTQLSVPGVNPPNNSFNSSWNGQPSIDIDTYNLNGLIQPGDSSARIFLGSGDGVVPAGNGESFLVGWMIMTFDNPVPILSGPRTRKAVSKSAAGPGEVLDYVIEVVNEGSQAATGVTVQDPMPPGTVYLPNSTRFDGMWIPDTEGQSPLAAGFNFGVLPTAMAGDNSRLLTFQVRVDTDVCTGTVSNIAVVSSDQTSPASIGPVVTTVQVPSLAQPIKTVSFSTPPPARPSTSFAYTITLENNGAVDVGGLTLTDPLPAHTAASQAMATSGDVSWAGDSVTVTEIFLAAGGGTAQVTILGVVDDLTTLRNEVGEGNIDGLLISNQATISGACNADMLTDGDAGIPGVQATEFRLTYSPVLSASTKAVEDLNGGFPEPGDILRYTIAVVNTGSRNTGVVVTDPIPPFTQYLADSTRLGSNPFDTVAVPDVGGTSPLVSGLDLGTVFAGGADVRLMTFDVRINAGANHGDLVTNSASLEAGADANANFVAVAADVMVFASPDFSGSSKAVVDLNGSPWAPGDVVEYTLQIANNGNRAATQVTVTDMLAGELVLVGSNPAASVTGSTLTWDLGGMAVGTSTPLTIQARVVEPLDDGTAVTNEAQVTALELLTPFTTLPVSFTIESAPVLVVSKEVARPVPTVPGDEVSYTIRITNVGDMVAGQIAVTDAIDVSLANVAAPTGDPSPGVIVWDETTDGRLSLLAPGAPEIVLTFTATVVTPLPDATVVSNQAVVTMQKPPGLPPVVSDDPGQPGTEDPTVFSVSSQATLTATKAVEDLSPATPFLPGDRVRYTLTLSADPSSTAPIRDLAVTDQVPIELTAIDATADNGTATGQTVAWSSAGNGALALLNPGDSIQLRFEAEVVVGTADATLVANDATADSGDLAGPVASNVASFTVENGAVLVATLAVALDGDDDPFYNAGDRVRYTWVVASAGTVMTTGVQVLVPIDPSLSITDNGGGIPVGNALVWTAAEVPGLGAMAPGETAVVEFVGSIDASASIGTLVSAQASVLSMELPVAAFSDDPNTVSLGDATEFTVVPEPTGPDLGTTEKAFVDPDTGDPLPQAKPRDRIGIRITVSNTGDMPAWDVRVIDDLDMAVLTQVTVEDGGTLVEGAARWRIARLDAGASVELHVVAALRVPLDAMTLSNQARWGMGGPAATPTNTAELQILADPDFGPSLKDVQSPSDRQVAPGGLVTYRIDVHNRGDGNARNVVVSDVLAAELQFEAASNGGSFAASTRTVTWTLPAVLGGARQGLALTVRVASTAPMGTITNQGSIQAPGQPAELTDDPQGTASDAPTSIEVVARPNFDTFAKSVVNLDEVAPGAVFPGDRLRYTLALTNEGTTAATSVEVRDPLDPRLQTNPTPLTPFRLEGNEVVFDSGSVAALGNMAPGQSVTLEFDVTAGTGLANGTVVSNRAFLVAAELGGPVPSDGDLATVGVREPTDAVLAYPVLQLTKDVVDPNGGAVEPGDPLVFSIVVGNGGGFSAQSLTITDVLAPQFELVSAPGAVQSGNTLTWTLGDLAPSDVSNLALEVRVAPTTPHGTVIQNQARAQAERVGPLQSDWPDTPAVRDPVRVQVEGQPELRLHKSVATPEGEVRPGDWVTYRIELGNEGRGPATALTIRDTLDEHLEAMGLSAGGRWEGRQAIWDVGTQNAGSVTVVELEARVRSGTANGTLIENQAQAFANELTEQVPSDDPSTPSVNDPTRLLVVAEPHFAATSLRVIDPNGGTVQPGDLLRYELTVRNDGTAAGEGVRATMQPPPYVAYLAGSSELNGEVIPGDSGVLPLDRGVLMRSGRPQTPDGVVLADDGQAPADELGILTFEVRVDPRALGGTVISAQVRVQANGRDDRMSDNPQTPSVVGDPTVVVVGGGPELTVWKEARLQQDVGEDGAVDVGDGLLYTITAVNSGDETAPACLLSDIVPEGTLYVPGTLATNGQTLTDDADQDEGESVASVVTARLGDLSPGAVAVLRFQVTVAQGPWIQNQAVVTASGRSWLSDGDPLAPGRQPTLTAVDETAPLLTLSLSPVDVDGGVVAAGDRVRYVMWVHNAGRAAVTDVQLEMVLSEGLQVGKVDGPGEATVVTEQPPTWFLANLRPGERLQVEVETRVDAGAVAGETMAAVASATVAQASFESEIVHLTIGGGVGTGAFAGRLYRDQGERNRAYDPELDTPMEGFSASLIPVSRLQDRTPTDGVEQLAVRTVLSGRSGEFTAVGIPPGQYVIWVYSAEGTQYAHTDAIGLAAGATVEQDLAVDPSGILYQEIDGSARGIAGARVFLVDWETGGDMDPAELLDGQQGQVSTLAGFYRFDVRHSALPRRVSIRVEPPGSTLVFPSATRPPLGADAGNAFGTPPSTAGSGGRIVEADFPDPQGDPTYYLRFDLSEDSPNYTNNHVPLDHLSSRIRVTKTASRRTASIGEILTYTVTVVNPTEAEIGLDVGGVSLVDDLPAEMEWVKGSAYRTTYIGASLRDGAPLPESRQVSARTVRFGAFHLYPHSTVTLRYYAVVGIRAKGKQTNRARLMAGNTLISNIAAATVRVVDDPMFVQGTVLGRVFCDEDGNGELGAQERGLPGARVYLDTGHYVDTDGFGKFHFRGVPPGRHGVKVDPNTLPPGSRPVTDLMREIFISRGLLAKLRFGLRCALEAVRPATVTTRAPPKGHVLVRVDPGIPAISFAGRAQGLPLVDVVLTPAGRPPDFQAGAGLAVSGPTELTWHLRAPSRVGVLRWEISLFDQQGGKEVWRVQGQGRPPKRVLWPAARTDFLKVGRPYLYRAAALSASGDLGMGRWRRLLMFAPEAAGPKTTVAAWSGELFESETDKPSPTLRTKVAALARELRGRSWAKLLVDVHVPPGRNRIASLALSQQQAEAIARLLRAQGFSAESLEARGRGDSDPLAQTKKRRHRDVNRRVVIQGLPKSPHRQKVDGVSYPGWLSFGHGAEPVPTTPVERNVEVKPGRPVVVDLRLEDGGRIRLSRTPPFADGEVASAPGVAIAVTGDVHEGTLTLAGDKVELSLLGASCEALDESLELTDKGLEEPMVFRLRSPSPLLAWQIRVHNPDGTVLRILEGSAAPKAPVAWDGLSKGGLSVVREGRYRYRCMFTDVDGNRAVLPQRAVQVVSGTPVTATTADTQLERVLTGDLYPEIDVFGDPVQKELDAAVELAASGHSRVEIVVHDHAAGGKLQAQIRTARLAKQLKEYLLARGVAGADLHVQARGATRPLVSGETGRAREVNRRVVMTVTGKPAMPQELAPQEQTGHVRIAGELASLMANGTFARDITVEPDSVVVVEMRTSDGRKALYHLPLFEGRPLVAGQVSVPTAGPPLPTSRRLGDTPEGLREAAPMPGLVGLGGEASHLHAEEGPTSWDSRQGAARVDAIAGYAPTLPPSHLVAPSAAPVLRLASSPPNMESSSKPPTQASTPSGEPPLHSPSGPPPDHPQAEKVTLPLALAPDVAAADLEVYLPADGATLPGRRLTVAGRSRVGNEVGVNGKTVALDEDGRFVHTLTLEPGLQRVELTARDQDGSIARLVRTFQVPRGEWFLLALTDTGAGLGQPFAGMNEDTMIALPQQIYLHGRTVAYFKGRVKGAALLGSDLFDDLAMTLHVDSGKEPQPELARQLIDPGRYYPVYGDSTEEVQDVSSRSKIYLLLQADESRLRIGNFQTKLRGLELFRYQRSYFGAALDVDHEFVAGQRTEVHAFAASDEAGISHRHLVIAATGGAMYFLKDAEVVEGTERVEIVVRDKMTGARLIAIPQTRDVDYRMAFRDGRLVFMQPIPSTVHAGWRLSQNPARGLQGHPIYVEMEYDYDGALEPSGESALAVQVRHTAFERVTLGLGVVDEDRSADGGGHYRLMGAEGRLRLSPQTNLNLELAYSQAKDADHWVSLDGGVTFGAIGSPQLSQVGDGGGRVPRATEGWAAKAQLAGDLADLVTVPQATAAAVAPGPQESAVTTAEEQTGEDGPKVEASARGSQRPGSRSWIPYALYFHHQDPGFFSGAGVLEQGQVKAGGQVRVHLNLQDSLRLRHDSIWSRLFVPGPRGQTTDGAQELRVRRHLSVAGYEHVREQWKAGAELGHNMGQSQGERGVHAGFLSAFGEVRLTPRWTGLGAQEVVAGGDRRMVQSLSDRFATTVAARYRLAETLWATLSETVRWSGSNSTELGLKTQITDDLSLYARERLLAGRGRWVNTTVVGGESSAIPGSRSYAEVQLDGLLSAQSSRAVLGMDNRWSVADGLTLSLSYERAQLVGKGRRVFAGSSGYAGVDPKVVGHGSGALNGQQQFAASGYNGAGTFPVGVSSRDAFATGLEYLRARTLTGSLRFELRYDRVDDKLGTPTLVGGNDRLVFFGKAGVKWRFQQDLVLLGTSQAGSVHNLDLKVGGSPGVESQFLDLSVGLAFRPAHSDRVEALLKWTRRYQRRAATEDRTQYQLEVADVLAVEPAVELGLGFQMVGKLAVKVFQADDAELASITSTTVLGLGRLNYHLSDMFDVAAEYRWLGNTLTEEAEHGALVEFAWIPVRYLSVGVGYNFTHFTDDLLTDPNQDQHGFFIRATGRY